jgi:DNA-binding NarL/FixJ family response regulator
MTARQRQVSECVGKGMCNKEIAVSLGIKVRTVKYFTAGLYRLAGLEVRAGRCRLQEQCRAGIFDESLTSIDG